MRVSALLDSRPARLAARALAAAIAAFGLLSWNVVLLGDKLLNLPALQMWDFNADSVGFFLHYGAIAGLFAVLGHYAAAWLQSRRSRPAAKPTATPRAPGPQP